MSVPPHADLSPMGVILSDARTVLIYMLLPDPELSPAELVEVRRAIYALEVVIGFDELKMRGLRKKFLGQKKRPKRKRA